MTLLTYIFLVAIGAGVMDFTLSRYVRLQESVYRIAFLVIYFLFVIRYYYGADIYNYVDTFEELHPLSWYLAHPGECPFERGFTWFFAGMKDLGVSYYWVTAIVTTFFFGVIWLYFNQIKRHKSLALMALVIFDYNLIFAAHRQCIAVGFFLLMLLALDKKQYLWALLMAYLCSIMHKSGIFMAGMVWMLYVAHNHRIERVAFQLLMVILALMLVLPLTGISTAFVSKLPMPESFTMALTEHLSLGRRIQVVWVMYAIVLLCLEYYMQYRKEAGKRGTEAVVILGVVLMVLLYQYFYLLNRLRSYFLPVVLVYLFRMIQDAEDRDEMPFRFEPLLKEVCTIVAIGYFGYATYRFEQANNHLHERAYTPHGKTIYSTSTVFDLRHKSAKEIQRERLLIAKYWWWYDYKKGENNKVSGN